MLNKNISKLILNNFAMKYVPQLNQLKIQKIYIGYQTNLFYHNYSKHTIKNLIENRNEFFYIPSKLESNDTLGNHWLFNPNEKYIWRPNLEIPNTIQTKLLNNQIYTQKIEKHPDIYQPVIVDDKYDKKFNLIPISINDLYNREL